MSRPRRSCTIPKPAPILSEVLEVVSAVRNSYYEEFKAVSKYYKDDVAQIRAFWMSNTSLYDFRNREHKLLLQHIFELIETKDSSCVAFLNTLSREKVRAIGLIRVERGTTVSYRVRVGELADTDHDTEWDDYYVAKDQSLEVRAR